MFKKLGIADQMAGKARMIPGTPVGESVAKGEAEIAFQQISELLPVPRITVVGAIPDSVQMITTFLCRSFDDVSGAGDGSSARGVPLVEAGVEDDSCSRSRPDCRDGAGESRYAIARRIAAT